MELATSLASWLASNSQGSVASNIELSYNAPTSFWDIMLLYSCGRMPLQLNTFNKNHVIVFYSNKISNSIHDRMYVSNWFYYFLFVHKPKEGALSFSLLQSSSRMRHGHQWALWLEKWWWSCIVQVIWYILSRNIIKIMIINAILGINPLRCFKENFSTL